MFFLEECFFCSIEIMLDSVSCTCKSVTSKCELMLSYQRKGCETLVRFFFYRDFLRDRKYFFSFLNNKYNNIQFVQENVDEIRQLLKIALQVICEFLLERFLVSFDPSQRAIRLKKKQKDSKKKRKARKSSFYNQFNFLERGIFRSCRKIFC